MRTSIAVLLALVVFAPHAAASDAVGSDAVEPRVVGGTVVADGEEYPYVVALVQPDGQQFCGGALVSPTRVVTAAHCTADTAPGDFLVVGGRLDLGEERGTVSEVVEVENHPDYVGAESGDDISWITTASAFPYEPVGLPGRGEDLYRAGTVGTVLGWGRTSEGGQQSERLREADIPITSNASCAEAYDGYDKTTMFCAGYPEGEVDACQGDSGGPFVVDGKLVGIVSWGVGCARPGKPGVYTRVAHYT
ncbi:serine protease [Actinosynnema sp. NPDC023587]|uniref:serine protease n=1 Tax=Actinosynnema sp. NPDC023587 TaxID=3154695 RepID=UPI0033DF89FB